MEMPDCDFKNMANYFKLLQCILEKWLKFHCSLLLLGEIISSSSRCSKSIILKLEKRFLVKCLRSIDQHVAKSA